MNIKKIFIRKQKPKQKPQLIHQAVSVTNYRGAYNQVKFLYLCSCGSEFETNIDLADHIKEANNG